jgi:hypothetical protein
MNKAIALVLGAISAASLVACGPPSYMVRVKSLIGSGQCSAAESEVSQYESDPGSRATMLAGIADECYRDRKATIRYLNLAARYGHPVAQEALVKMGEPVPSADLKGTTTNCYYIRGLLSCTSN